MAALIATLGPTSLQAQQTPAPPAAKDESLRYVIGLKLRTEPTYSGAAKRGFGLTPLWAVRLGRWRLSAGGVGSLIANRADAGSGATTDLYKGERFASSLGLRFDGGRSSSDDPMLAGLPNVRSTLRLRLAGRWQEPGSPWRFDGNLSVDTLGRGSGTNAGLGVGYGGRWSPQTTWGVGAGIGLGDSTYLNARYGVPLAAARADRPAYRPGAGWTEAGIGLGTHTELSPNWVLLADVHATHLLGPAADSPLTRQRSALGASISVVWRPRR